MLLAHAKVDYYDERLSGDEYESYKTQGRIDKVPELDHEGQKVYLTTPILEYLGEILGYFDKYDAKKRFMATNVINAMDANIDPQFSKVFFLKSPILPPTV